MAVTNISRNEYEALKTVDLEVLRQRIKQCINEEKSYGLRDHQLDACGFPVITHVGIFERALTEYCQAKSPKKRAETLYSAERAGRNLVDAVSNQKALADQQQQERTLFYVEDQIIPPTRFTNKLSVRINYQWRKTPDDSWTAGSINFTHDVKPQHDFMAPRPARKPSAARKEQERQDSLYREWENLKNLALFSLNEYLRNGGDGSAIPAEFKAKADPRTDQLNNFSAQFFC